jgi:hypothetical protein
MKPLILEATEDTPEVYFNPAEGIFRLAKSSLPENAIMFYKPIIEWLKEYGNNPNPKTVFDFDIEYLNTASSKQIFEVIMLINELSQKSDVSVVWRYDVIDEDMLGLGTRFSHLVKVKFDFVPYENDDMDY